jgi:hypothetical protein
MLMMQAEGIWRKTLMGAVAKLSDEEIDDQAFLVGAEGHLRGETRNGKAISLLEFCMHRKLVKDLVKNIAESRPDIWAELTSSLQSDRAIEITITIRLLPNSSTWMEELK